MLANLAYSAWVEVPTLPWAVLPMSLNAFGIALVFPILTLAILDLYPRQRGAASSMQAFVGLSFNATVAGAIAPWANQSGLRMAWVASAFFVLAWSLWRAYRRRAKREPQAPAQPAALEPTERF
jgi:DHA1 family bicyclomycin/chloramphenicol resistance-like MFS transporter